jgi:hypothetical protein
MVKTTYAAASLEDIAQQFDSKAVDAETSAKSAGTQRDKRLLIREAEVWRRAANVLRATTLEPHEERDAN